MKANYNVNRKTPKCFCDIFYKTWLILIKFGTYCIASNVNAFHRRFLAKILMLETPKDSKYCLFTIMDFYPNKNVAIADNEVTSIIMLIELNENGFQCSASSLSGLS